MAGLGRLAIGAGERRCSSDYTTTIQPIVDRTIIEPLFASAWRGKTFSHSREP